MYQEIYKRDMKDLAALYFGYITKEDEDIIDRALDFSIQERGKSHNAFLENNYKNVSTRTTLLKMVDFIEDKQPIVTSYGTLFVKHGVVPNPLGEVVQGFLDLRAVHKKKMFEFPKGSNQFEYYNLLQSLDKVNANSIYGTLGQYTSLVYNKNVATSITASGRTFISVAGMFFEQFLANNVKFASVDEVLMFIKHTVSERGGRKFDDNDILSHWISKEECFAKLVLDCGGYGKRFYIPDEDDLEMIWRSVCSLTQEDVNRVYYKNNLYEFLMNDSMIKAIRIMMQTLQRPFLTPDDIPEEIQAQLDLVVEILDEYVMNHFQVMDRIIRWQVMMHEVCVISDTDSAFVSLDAWVRFATSVIQGMDIPIGHITTDMIKLAEEEHDAFYRDNPTMLDYDFYNEKVIERKRAMNPFIVIPQDNIRYSLISIMTHIVSILCNKYIEEATKTSHSWSPDRKCKMYLKNEFLMKRILMTSVKKNYASLQELQEGHVIDHNIKAALDTKGIECLTKSTKSESTRKALRRILYEDILDTDNIDQVKVIKDMAILEKMIIKSLMEGSKEYYKPMTVKSMDAYNNPMTQQGVKGILAWNALKDHDEETIDTTERNAVSIAKVKINPYTLENEIRTNNPALYKKVKEFLEKYRDNYKSGSIDAIAIPINQPVPQWVIDVIDYDEIVSDNIAKFPLESINIRRTGSTNINYTNMLKL